MKVAIIPTWRKPDKADGGIRRVSEAQWKHLPKFGIEPVADTEEAEVIACHGTALVTKPNVPTVHHGHGLYWSRYDWPDWAHEANRLVVESMSASVAHTAPSRWVANAIRRGMLAYPEVVYHGVDPDEWTPAEDWQPFVLWNKARKDIVSNPQDMQKLARLLLDIRFNTTIVDGDVTNNVHKLGIMPIESMREWVRHSGLYLATARETFGIGTLEAMSCGVPVVGWDWGGQSEIIKHGETGFLAEPGDYQALAEGVKWALENRKVLGENARSDVLTRWTWEPRIKQYAEFYKRTKRWWDKPEVKVSVIVTCHNLGRYLEDCLKSVESQGFKDWECLIVNDASTDETAEIANKWSMANSQFSHLTTPENLKLPMARNFGFEHAKGEYILPLDADDMLAENALLTLASELDKDKTIHIAYGHLDGVNDKGEDRKRNDWPMKEFNWYEQIAHLNQLPYSAMIRREVFERTGGYRRRHWRAEDAPLWIKASSYGFRIKKVTQAATLIYRFRSDSKSMGEPGDGDWTSWFPFRLGAKTGKEGAQLMRSYRGISHPHPELVPWGAQGEPVEGMRFWYVPDHTEPLLSFIIPVGPGHEHLLVDALDSIQSQIFQEWECIVVNATGKKWDEGFNSPVAGSPWAKVIDGGKRLNPAQARNLGAKHAKAEAIFFLDADDMILPEAIEEMYPLHIGTAGGLVYGDWIRSDSNIEAPLTYYESDEFVCGAVLKRMRHSNPCIIPKWAHDEVGGYDEEIPGWEDWDYQIALQSVGVCSYRYAGASIVYRFREGTIREDSFGKKDAILPIIREKWKDYYEGKKKMPCGRVPCGKKRRSSVLRGVSDNQLKALSSPDYSGDNEEMMLLIYQGPGDKVRLRGRITDEFYRFKNGMPKYVRTPDALVFLQLTRKGKPDFLKVEQPQTATSSDSRKIIEDRPKPTVEKPEFPTMPDVPETVVIEDVGKLTIDQLKPAVLDAEEKTLLSWLEDERAGKNRIGAKEVIENELNSRASKAVLSV